MQTAQRHRRSLTSIIYTGFLFSGEHSVAEELRCMWANNGVSVLLLWKISEIHNFKRGNVYFGSQLQRFLVYSWLTLSILGLW